MIKIELKLPKRLEERLNYLEVISKKSKEFIVQEALIQYVEDMEDIQKLSVLSALEKKQKIYTAEELNKKIRL